MNIHEYQAKSLLREYGLPVANGRPIMRSEDAKTAAGEIGRAGMGGQGPDSCGRKGKGNLQGTRLREARAGFELRTSVEEAATEARKMLGRTLVTHQTGSTGKTVNRVYIEEGASVDRELYLALLLDRQSSRISFVCSTEGGMDIEEVAAARPEKIATFAIDPATGTRPYLGKTNRVRAETGGQADPSMRRFDIEALQIVSRQGCRTAGKSTLWSSAQAATCSALIANSASIQTLFTETPTSWLLETSRRKTPRNSPHLNST